MPRTKRVPRNTPRNSPYTRGHEDADPNSPYTPINSENGEIRVSKLAPGKFDDTLVMHLVARNLSDISQAPYEALSYVWGTEISSKKAYANDIPITITSNLDCALRHLRLNIVPRILWIDAVSMNQNDTQERNHQAQLMGTIYSRAQSVIVWLGTIDKNDLHSKAILGAMQFHFVEREPSIIMLFDYICGVLSLLCHGQNCAQSQIEEKVMEALHRIVNRPWFHRIWVVQELALSQSATIQIGPYSFPWQPFEFFFKWLPQHKVKTKVHSGFVEAAARVEKAKSRTPFADQLFRTAHLSATDSRDKVFGILGIATFTRNTIRADYTKQPHEVFSEAAAVLVQQKRLDLYLHLPLQPPRGQVSSLGLPSWVPDLQIRTHPCSYGSILGEDIWSHPETNYNHPITTSGKHEILLGDYLKNTCQRATVPQTMISDDGSRLTVPGIPIGVILKTSEDLFSDLYDAPRSTLIHKVGSLYHSIGKPYNIGHEDFISAFGIGTGDNWDWKHAMLVLCNPDMHDLVLIGSVRRAINDICTDIMSSAAEKIFFVTNTGHVGRVYHPDPLNGVRPGDVVVGLFGINFPFVLRREEYFPNDQRGCYPSS
jgi:hypothetical protein